jgi:hypothetical protein
LCLSASPVGKKGSQVRLKTPLRYSKLSGKLKAMKKLIILILALAAPLVFTSCSFSLKTQKHPAGIDVRTSAL